MRILTNLNGRVTFALPVVSPKVDFPAPCFVVASMTKYTVDFYIRGMHGMRGSGLDVFKGSDAIIYGPIEDHHYHMHGRWYHGSIEDEATWQRMFDVQNPCVTSRTDYTLDYSCTYDGVEFVTETIVLDDLVQAIASFYNGRILEQLESSIENKTLKHEYWILR